MQHPESYAAAPGRQSFFEGSSDAERRTDKHPELLPIVTSAVPKKPVRPLTAYHIFFQIEREFIIQTCAGQDDEDASIHEGKVCLAHVPPRYREIKLLPEWYAGPGKRQKRKHRKQHGKIGFLDLSRAISKRWARLEEVDPETKRFVERIARQEIEIYYHEMKHYKEITKDHVPQAPVGAPQAATTTVPGRKRKSTNITSIAPQAPPVSAAASAGTPGADVPHLSSDDLAHQVHRKRKMTRKMTRHQESPLSLSNFDPILTALDFLDASKKRCMDFATSFGNPFMAEVDIPDEEILQMWLSHNAP